MLYLVMKGLSVKLAAERARAGLLVKEAAAAIGIDASLLSRLEHGQRMPTRDQVLALCSLYQCDANTMIKSWLSERIVHMLAYEPLAQDALVAAESRLEYLQGQKVLEDLSPSAGILHQLAMLDELKARWSQLPKSDRTAREKLTEQVRTEFTFNSNQIEGNTLTLQETHLVINEGLTVSGKPLRDHLEAVDHSEAVEYIGRMASGAIPFCERELKLIHQLVLKGTNKQEAGTYRSLPVRISGSHHVPPEPYGLGKLMEDYFLQYHHMAGRVHPVLLAAEMHERLVTIHPFIDGNGRTARLVMNLLLLQHDFPIAILKGDGESRRRYYDALQQVQSEANPEPFYEMVIEAVKASLEHHIHMCGG